MGLLPVNMMENGGFCVLDKKENTDEVLFKFLHPAGPAPSFSYPSKDDTLLLPRAYILKKVDANTQTGRTYH